MNQNLHEGGDMNCSLCEHVERTMVALEVHYIGVHGVTGSPTKTEEPEARPPLMGGQDDNYIKLNNDPWMGYSDVSSTPLKSSSCPITRTEGSTEGSINTNADTEELSVNIVFQGRRPPIATIEIESTISTPSSKEYYQPSDSEIPSFENYRPTESAADSPKSTIKELTETVASSKRYADMISLTEKLEKAKSKKISPPKPPIKETTTAAAKYTCEFCEVKNFTFLDLEGHQLAVHGELGFGIPETDRISLPEKTQKQYPPQKPPRKLLVPQNSIRSSQTPSINSTPLESPMTRALARLRVKKALFSDPKENTPLSNPPSNNSNPPNSEKVRKPLKKFLQVSLRRLSEEEILLVGGPNVFKPSVPLPLPEDSDLLTAHEHENEKLFHFYATVLEKKAILNVEKSKQHIVFRNMRQNLLHRVDSRVFQAY